MCTYVIAQRDLGKPKKGNAGAEEKTSLLDKGLGNVHKRRMSNTSVTLATRVKQTGARKWNLVASLEPSPRKRPKGEASQQNGITSCHFPNGARSPDGANLALP